ncbi:MAG: sulfotransferase [Candidatus Competibacterales bacterium]
MSIAIRRALIEPLNAVGVLLARAGWRGPSLAEDDLLAAARRVARLEDFGPEAYLAPLPVLLRALEGEAQLNLVGRVATRAYLLELLTNRLRISADRRGHPAIAAQEIRAPLIITGLPRTGSTLLHGLLAQDPALRAPATWEVMMPSPPPEGGETGGGGRIAAVARRLAWADRLIPSFKAIHPMGAQLPQECIAIMGHAFASIQFPTTYYIPSYQRWLDAVDLELAYRCHREFLQHLQYRHWAQRWVLKAPGHLFSLEALFAVYPDACIVQTHRDPLTVTASIVSLVVALRRAFSDAVDPIDVAQQWAPRWAMGLASALAFRDSGAVAAERFFDLQYTDLLRDPLAAVRSIYRHFDLPLSPLAVARMKGFLAENPQHKHGRHSYSLEAFGLDYHTERRRYASYCERFSPG